jgi:hypothetical protein
MRQRVENELVAKALAKKPLIGEGLHGGQGETESGSAARLGFIGSL